MKYRKKPVVIDAIQWTGNNLKEIMYLFPDCFGACVISSETEIVITTLEGNMIASKGDYIIKGIKGEFYPCKPDIFEATYELVE